MIKLGDTCKVLEECSKLAAGTSVVVLGHIASTNEYWCQAKEGRACYWIKAEELQELGPESEEE